MRAAKWVLSAIIGAASLSAAAEGTGLIPHIDNLPWARWQGRVSLTLQEPPFATGLSSSAASGLQLSGVSLMGDYYLTHSLIGSNSEGGLHATSGLILTPRSQPLAGQPVFGAQGGAFSVARRNALPAAALPGSDSSNDFAKVPYLGVGYTGLSAKGSWSFSADLGLVALAAGNAVKFGRVFNGNQSLDDLVREMRVAPLMQVGASYSF